MAWVILEGVDRSGKSSVAEYYKQQGYTIVHMLAPRKEFLQPGYSGPSYMDEMLDMYLTYDGQNIIFDRSIYGETVWPYVYGRKPQLTDDDIEVLREFEDRNEVRRILMIDTDKSAHWKRCVDNKEPLNYGQFMQAGALYSKMAHKYNFIINELKDFDSIKRDVKHAEIAAKDAQPVNSSITQEGSLTERTSETNTNSINPVDSQTSDDSELVKLEQANAIKDILSKRILKQKGGAFDQLEDSMRSFLKTQLSSIFNKEDSKNKLNDDEVAMLKLMCQRIRAKEDKK